MFCRHCGKQLADEAYVCPSCGGLIRPLPTVAPAPAVAAPQRKERLERLSKIFTKIGIIFNAVAFGLVILTWIGLVISMISLDGFYSHAYEAEYDLVILYGVLLCVYAWIFSVLVSAIGFELSTAGFVLGIIQKYDEGIKRKSTVVFIWGIILFTVSFLGYVGMIILMLGLA